MDDRLQQQLAFLNEIEQLKAVHRRNRTLDGGRFENSAEHSWHVALMALMLLEHADEPSSINPLRVEREYETMQQRPMTPRERQRNITHRLAGASLQQSACR